MIMIIWLLVMIFYLMWYLINSWKLLSENPQSPPEKIHSPSKNSKSASVPPFLLTMKIFSTPSAPPPSLHSRLCRVALLALLYKVLLCRLVWLTDFLEIQSPKEDVCYRRHKILDCLWAGYGLHKVYHIRYNHRKIQTRSGKK